jgi:hypothetical protein
VVVGGGGGCRSTPTRLFGSGVSISTAVGCYSLSLVFASICLYQSMVVMRVETTDPPPPRRHPPPADLNNTGTNGWVWPNTCHWGVQNRSQGCQPNLSEYVCTVFVFGWICFFVSTSLTVGTMNYASPLKDHQHWQRILHQTTLQAWVRTARVLWVVRERGLLASAVFRSSPFHLFVRVTK